MPTKHAIKLTMTFARTEPFHFFNVSNRLELLTSLRLRLASLTPQRPLGKVTPPAWFETPASAAKRTKRSTKGPGLVTLLR